MEKSDNFNVWLTFFSCIFSNLSFVFLFQFLLHLKKIIRNGVPDAFCVVFCNLMFIGLANHLFTEKTHLI